MKIYFLLLLSLCLISGCDKTETAQSESGEQLIDTTSKSTEQQTTSTANIEIANTVESENTDNNLHNASLDIEKAFSSLTWVRINQEHNGIDGSRLGYPTDSFRLIEKRLENLPKNDVRYDAQNDEEYFLMGEYQNKTMKEAINVFYTDGPSADPEFMLSDQNNKTIWSVGADEMAILANGIIYISGHSNELFNKKQKYQLKDGKVREIKQPFYYVGYTDKLLKPISLYSQKTRGELVASLPVGSEIEVLLAEGDPKRNEEGWFELEKNYLVRTPFGLVGWLRLSDDEAFGEPVISNLRYWGD